MKNKLNTGFLFLFSLLILLSCDDLYLLKDVNKNSAVGYFSLAGGEDVRTIIPAGGNFYSYTLDFFMSGETEDPYLSLDKIYNELYLPVAVNAGEWDLRVTAYMDRVKEQPAAIGILTGIVIKEGELTSKKVELMPIMDEQGKGTFTWSFGFGGTISTNNITMKITPLFEGADELELRFLKLYDTIILDSGYYRVLISCIDWQGGRRAERSEILHIYNNMASYYNFTFYNYHFLDSPIIVTSGADSGEGTLREALSLTIPKLKILVDSSVEIITLLSPLPVFAGDLEIEGNGVIITGEITGGAAIRATTGNKKISRIWFKDIVVNGINTGAAINADCNLVLESCIFSGNNCVGVTTNSMGGAVIFENSTGTLEIKGCTFYKNHAGYGGAVYIASADSITMIGNLFYANTANVSGSQTIYKRSTSSFSSATAYNIMDTQVYNYNTSTGSAVNITPTGFTRVTSSFLNTENMQVIKGSPAYNNITSIPSGYPQFDFYGKNLIFIASAGAVQEESTGGEYNLSVSVNSSVRGFAVTAPKNPDGSYTITANTNSGYGFSSWLVNGINSGNENSITLTLKGHTEVKAVFGVVYVTSPANSGQGTLRNAFENLINGDIIRVNLTAPDNVITLSSSLPDINKSFALEGNGIIITSSGTLTQPIFKFVSNAENYDLAANRVISRVWFKDIKSDSSSGTVIFNQDTNINISPLNLESCIFSENNYGSTIYNYGVLNMRGCTMYGNYADKGAAVYFFGPSWAALTLTGNVFYNNTTDAPDGFNFNIDTSGKNAKYFSNGYNVIDNRGDSLQIILSYATGDILIPVKEFIYNKDMKVIPDSAIDNVIPALPIGYPEYDFFGNKITAPAAAGAVQERIKGNGYYLVVSADETKGSVNITPQGSTDFYTGTVTLTAQPKSGYALRSWIINDVHSGVLNPLTLNMTEHKKVQAVFGNLVEVTSYADSGPSTLRQALLDAQNGDVIQVNLPAPDNTITLLSNIYAISKSITINGNGVIITSAVELTHSPLTFYETPDKNTTISRIWFKDIKTTNYGGAISTRVTRNDADYNQYVVESCIFSGNSSNVGGAIDNYGVMYLKGCTFYGNSSSGNGGAILTSSGGNNIARVHLIGNLFYGNTAVRGRSVSLSGGLGEVKYNIYDNDYIHINTGPSSPGFSINKIPDDIITERLFIDNEMRVLSGSEADGIIKTLPAGYPSFDFYGAPIKNGACAGAIQTKAAPASGYYVVTKVNNSARGQISVTPFGTNGYHSSAVTFTAQPNEGFALFNWIVNGTDAGSSNPLTMTLTNHADVQAVFYPVIISAEDDGPGTLRKVFENIENGDIITVNLPVGTKIELLSALPDIEKSITIRGNGVVLTHSSIYARTKPLFNIVSSAVDVKISRIWFKDYLGRTTVGITGINAGTNVDIESCIFSGNMIGIMSVDNGAAISSSGANVAVRGCTFYSNTAKIRGAIMNESTNGSFTIAGSIFYDNNSYFSSTGKTAAIYCQFVNKGYNVIDNYFDVPLGEMLISAPVNNTDNIVTESPFIDTTTFKPAIAIRTLIPASTWARANMPTVDFYGTARDWTTAGAPGAVE